MSEDNNERRSPTLEQRISSIIQALLLAGLIAGITLLFNISRTQTEQVRDQIHVVDEMKEIKQEVKDVTVEIKRVEQSLSNEIKRVEQSSDQRLRNMELDQRAVEQRKR